MAHAAAATQHAHRSASARFPGHQHPRNLFCRAPLFAAALLPAAPRPMARAAGLTQMSPLMTPTPTPTPTPTLAPTAPLRPCLRRCRRADARANNAGATATPEIPKAEPGKTTLAFVGIGIMGLAMATNLLKAGYDVVVWNRSPERCAPLVAAGARLAATPREAAAAATVVFGMLADPPAALAVATGPQGVAAGMSPGKGYVDVSTVDAATSRAVAAAMREQGGLFLEAPVSGSKGPAENGQLIFLTAGDEALFQACSPALDVMGKASFYLGGEGDGAVGSGAHMKLVVNQIMGAMMVALAEGLALAKAAGLSEAQVLEVASLGAIANPMFALKGPAMVERRYPAAFPLKHQQKDLRLALELANELGGLELGVARAAHEAYARASASKEGRGDEDFSAVLEAVLPPPAP